MYKIILHIRNIQLNGIRSGYQCIKFGIPQGSLLGPLPFL